MFILIVIMLSAISHDDAQRGLWILYRFPGYRNKKIYNTMHFFLQFQST